jgi:hypothetical protein
MSLVCRRPPRLRDTGGLVDHRWPGRLLAGFGHQCDVGIGSVRVEGSTPTGKSRSQRDQRESQTQNPGDNDVAKADTASEH